MTDPGEVFDARAGEDPRVRWHQCGGVEPRVADPAPDIEPGSLHVVRVGKSDQAKTSRRAGNNPRDVSGSAPARVADVVGAGAVRGTHHEVPDRESLRVFVMGTASRAGSDYIGNSGGSASGDVSGIIPGAAARFGLIGFSDSNDVKRTWLYVRGGIGYARFYPSALMPPDAWVFAGPGIEYFTRIRHFSIGFEVNASYLLKSKTFGFALAPNLSYAF